MFRSPKWVCVKKRSYCVPQNLTVDEQFLPIKTTTSGARLFGQPKIVHVFPFLTTYIYNSYIYTMIFPVNEWRDMILRPILTQCGGV